MVSLFSRTESSKDVLHSFSLNRKKNTKLCIMKPNFTKHVYCTSCFFTTIFVDTRLWKTKHQRKRFQNFCQSYVLSTDRIEIHQLQPLAWPSDLLYVILAGCDWWISIPYVNNTWDWWKFWKRFHECFVFQSRVSPKTVVIHWPWS